MVEQWFDMVPWNADHKYSPQDVILSTYQQDFLPDAWFRYLEKSGHRIVIDHLMDSDVSTPNIRLTPNKLEIRNGNWMWYRTALLVANAGYDQYRPSRSYSHDFLCLMNKVRDHRDRVMKDLALELEHARWSYVAQGVDIGDPRERATPVFWEYYMNPQWYDSTCWHLVVESYMRTDTWLNSPMHPNYKTEISEKSYKPLAYYQPFVVLGSAETLHFLHQQGFETFDNLWPEHYDQEMKDARRLDMVLDLVRTNVKTYNRYWSGWDKLTEEKMAHNHARFFDLALVAQRFDEEIIATIQEFLAE